MDDFITIPDLDPLALVPDNAEIYVTHNGNDYRTTKADFLAALTNGKQDVLTSTNFGAFHVSLLPKTTIVDADLTMISDSANSGHSKKVTWLNIWFNYIRAKVLSELINFKSDNFLDATSSIQDQLDSKPTMVAGIIQSYNLPSFIDDVVNGYLLSGVFYLESSHTTVIAAEVGKIYIDLTSGQSNKQYRYSGSVYIQITNGLIASTNDVPEGTNLYYTDARVKALISGTTSTIPKFKSGGGVEDSAISETSTEIATAKTFNAFAFLYQNAIEVSFSDLQTLKTPGHYKGAVLSNAPNSGWFYIEVRRHTNDYVQQTLYSMGASNAFGEVYNTWCVGGTWTGFKKSVTTEYLDAEINDLLDDIEANFTPLVVPTATISTQAVNLQQLTETIALSHQVNITTASLSLTYLEATYSARQPGFEVLCPFIASGAGIYKKMEFGVWGFNTITIVT